MTKEKKGGEKKKEGEKEKGRKNPKPA